MAPRHQHTFTLVPNPMGMQGLMSRPTNAPQSKPPMTSKQAQKLYREATRGPRLSKAEQRRIEREEQERIRRELDREKQLNRARVLRERKKAKEQQALDEKKRKGLPLINVTPSQDTIARFVRGNGTAKKRDAEGGRVVGPAVSEETKTDGDRSVFEDRSNEKAPLEEAAGSNEPKRRRLEHDEHFDGDGPQMAPEVRTDASPAATTEQTEMRNPIAETQTPLHSDSVICQAEGAHVPRGAAGTVEGEGKGRPASGHTELTTESGLAQTGPQKTADTPMMATNPILDSQRRSTGSGALVDPLKAANPSLDRKTPKGSPIIPPILQETSARGTTTHEKAKVTTSLPLPSRLTVPPLPKKTPLMSKRLQAPNPLHRPAPLPQQRPPPKAPTAQHGSTRPVLKEITNSSHRTRPVSVVDGASKFSSPYKPTMGTPHRQSPATTPAFKQPKPKPAAGAMQRPQFLPQQLRNAATLDRQASSTSVAKAQSREAQNEFLSDPPTSTQLFILSHLDEVLPSPTQEAREVQGEPPPAVPKLAQPEIKPPPIATFVADKPKQRLRQVTHAKVPMAPPPRPLSIKRATEKVVTGKPTTSTDASDLFELSFLSTQDLSFSSQDLRELDEPTSVSGNMGPENKKHPPAFRQRPQANQRPPPLSSSSSRNPVQLRQATPQRRLKPPASTTKHCPNAAGKLKPLRDRVNSINGCSDPTCGSEQKQKHDNNKHVPDRPPSVAQPRAPSPEKPRFFGSSGEGMVALALGRSLKTYREEEKRRRREHGAQLDATNDDSVGNEQAMSDQIGCLQNKESQTRTKSESREHGNATIPQQRSPTTNTNSTSTVLHRADAVQAPHIMDTASQETDYGDVELDSLDIEDLFATAE
ncbi:hypothetical protein C7999DRAFT_42460 [Corynascus novoguineensis]|uniref:Uncharacterized protein n=1 Tax=Corynascus novoguineensis TaxID=1126955 RepID=A0AAN7CSI6_9PEZI|nr:hypothetical protein C7999DRAFT_42460 [Corynascus novoguineensis]